MFTTAVIGVIRSGLSNNVKARRLQKPKSNKSEEVIFLRALEG